MIGILPTSAVVVIPKRLSEHHMKLHSFPSEMSEACHHKNLHPKESNIRDG